MDWECAKVKLKTFFPELYWDFIFLISPISNWDHFEATITSTQSIAGELKQTFIQIT